MEIVIHIGIQRTGSTFLQNEIFRRSNSLNYLRNDYVNQIMRNIRNKNSKFIENEVYKLFSNDKINLISEENIYSGDMWTNDDIRYNNLDKLKNFFPESKIIFGIRNKEDLLLSWYKKYIICGGILKFSDFISEIINIELMNYEPYIDRLYSYFGKENVFIYEYKQLKTDTDQLVTNICDFIGINPVDYKNRRNNIGYSKWQLIFSRMLNHLFKNDLNMRGIIPLHYLSHPHRKIFQNPKFPKILRGREIRMDDLN